MRLFLNTTASTSYSIWRGCLWLIILKSDLYLAIQYRYLSTRSSVWLVSSEISEFLFSAGLIHVFKYAGIIRSSSTQRKQALHCTWCQTLLIKVDDSSTVSLITNLLTLLSPMFFRWPVIFGASSSSEQKYENNHALCNITSGGDLSLPSRQCVLTLAFLYLHSILYHPTIHPYLIGIYRVRQSTIMKCECLYATGIHHLKLLYVQWKQKW